jgi:hypothetical protein
MSNLPPIYIWPRAIAIARGLARSARADRAVIVGNWLRAKARRGNEFYFLSANGTRLLRGLSLSEATELTPGFAQAMAKRGA